jgi:hypothetical protein
MFADCLSDISLVESGGSFLGNRGKRIGEVRNVDQAAKLYQLAFLVVRG